MGVEFGLLGDVEIRVEGRQVDAGHARQLCVLVVLLVEANRAVSADQLVGRVWGDCAPASARETLRSYLSRLRRVLGPIAGADVRRQTGGYVLTVDPMTVDVHRFTDLLAQARAADDEDRAMVLFEQALGLWRGEPCAGLDTPWVTALREGLEWDRSAAELDYTDLQLRRGQHRWLLKELASRAEAHPLDERVAGQLMLALYRCGRQAEALEHFQRLRVRLAEELGIDPSQALQHRYQQILTDDPSLTVPIPGGSLPVAIRPPVPRQLPPHTPHFVGRARELRELTTLCDTAAAGGGTVVITAIGGTAGIGKTTLALHWAHQAADQFPDGQLYVNLRGFDPTDTPMHPAEALRRFLDAFSVPSERIPTSVDAQAGLYRSLLTDRHVLIMLDNARDSAQIRPLLPASPACLVVITSRNQLPDLVSHHGAHPVTLDVLTTQEARILLTCHLGPDRVSVEPQAITDLINYCARLPLALAIVAAQANAYPGFELRVLAKELADEHTRLDALDTGEATTSVRAVFSWSYRHLSPPAALVFRLLGLYPGVDIVLPVAARLADIPLVQARNALDELSRAHLLTQHAPGRYTFHDLLRAYASHLNTAHDSQHDRQMALTRLFDHYLHTAAAAMETLYPNDPQHPARVPPSALPTAEITDATSARAWLDSERTNVTAIIVYTAANGWHTHTTQLANTVLRYLEICGHHHHAQAIYTHALQAAHHTDDTATEAHTLTNLGMVHWQQGRYLQATEHHQQAIIICRKTGFRAGEALAMTNLGLVQWQLGRYLQATEHHQQAIVICRETGDLNNEAYALGNLGVVYWQQGHYRQAIDLLQRAVSICRETGFTAGEVLALTHLGLVYQQQGHYQQATDHHNQVITSCGEIGFPVGKVLALTRLGLVHQRQGNYRQAADCHGQAIVICREVGFPFGEVLVLTHLGLVHCKQGRTQQAAEHHHQALKLCREIGDRATEPQIRNNLGETQHACGQQDQARTQHAYALTLATGLGDRYEHAHAHHGLARTYRATADLDQARHHWQQALVLYTDLGVPEVNHIRDHQTTLH